MQILFYNLDWCSQFNKISFSNMEVSHHGEEVHVQLSESVQVLTRDWFQKLLQTFVTPMLHFPELVLISATSSKAVVYETDTIYRWRSTTVSMWSMLNMWEKDFWLNGVHRKIAEYLKSFCTIWRLIRRIFLFSSWTARIFFVFCPACELLSFFLSTCSM